jgi:hypothetical protein
MVDSLLSDTQQPSEIDASHLMPGTHAFVVPRSLASSFSMLGASLQGKWFWNPGPDPVIEWIVSRVQEDILHSGRLYFVSESANPDTMQFIEKPKEILDLADALFAWTRNWAKRSVGRPCGPVAARAVREGHLRLARPTWSWAGFSVPFPLCGSCSRRSPARPAPSSRSMPYTRKVTRRGPSSATARTP